MDFSCTAKQTSDRVVIAVVGEVDFAAHKAFQAEVEQSWDGSSSLVIDLSRVTFLDSMGLRVLVQTRQRAVNNNRDLTLATPSRPVLRVLDLAGATSLFTVVDPLPDEKQDSDTAS